MRRTKQFGETVVGYSIPVLNEREIRAAAGILYLIMFWSWILVIFLDNYILLKIANTMFLADFVVRLFISPKYSPSLMFGRFIVRNQTPEYVGAAQKKFAWTIGLVLSTIIFFLLVVLNSDSFINFIVCHTCMIFLFFESSFGICFGCKFYSMFYKEKAQYCPGEICEIKEKEKIQRMSLQQITVIMGYLAFVIMTVILFNDGLGEKPTSLWLLIKTALLSLL